MRRWAAITMVAGALLLAACSSTFTVEPSTAPAATSQPPASPSASPPVPTPVPLPPAAPGRARGEMLFAQRAEDASLVSGEQPIRLTLARTGNEVAWFTAPPQQLAGVMTTEQMMLSLGWRPSDDGTTALMPTPRPNGMLSSIDSDLPFTVQRASVRADGTLVLDISPMGALPETVPSYGPVTLALDGVPGVVVIDDSVSADVTTRVIITGDRNQQAVVQIVTGGGEIVESRFVARDRPIADDLGDVVVGATELSDIVIGFQAPNRRQDGQVTVSGALTVGGTASRLNQVVARWTLPVTT